MKAVMMNKMPVKEWALIRRINRVLDKELKVLRKSRGDRWWSDLGDYYIVDYSSNFLVRAHIDLDDLGSELGVLKQWECLVRRGRLSSKGGQ